MRNQLNHIAIQNIYEIHIIYEIHNIYESYMDQYKYSSTILLRISRKPNLKEATGKNSHNFQEIMGKRRYNDDKEDPGTCGFCKKSFETLSKFLRHVSHSKLCLEDYDPTVIKSLKEKSRLKSKRKWFHKNSNTNDE